MAQSTAAELMRTIGRRIAEARRARGLKQKEVAQRARMDLDVYKRLERGSRISSLRTIARVLDVLEVQPRDVVILRDPNHVRRPGRPPNKRVP